MWILNVQFNAFTWNFLSLVILSASFNVSVLGFSMYFCFKKNNKPFIYLFIYLFIYYVSQKQKEMLRAVQSGGKVIVKPRKT